MYRHGAVVFSKKRPTGKGYNSLKSRPLLKDKYKYFSTHAECQSILNAKGKGDTLIVVRILKNGQLSESKPCNKCLAFAKDYGIKKIYYSTWSGEIRLIKL